MRNICRKFLSVILILFSQSALAKGINITTVGKESLSLPNNINISIVEFDKSESDGHRFWKSKLVVKNGSNTLIEKYPIIEGYDDNYFYYLTPIKSGKYFTDLDGDQFYEFAVAVDHGGNAPATSATVYSLIGKELKIYKKAWYQMENGQEIIWKKENAPKKHIYR